MLRFINNFNKDKVHNLINRDMDALDKFHESFDYVHDRLPKNNLKNLNKCNWYETKNYNYCRIDNKDVSLIIRHYHTHFIIFTRLIEKKKTYMNEHYNIVSYQVGEREDRDNSDDYFIELNKSLPDIIDLVRKQQVHTFWNDYCIKKELHVEHKVILDTESIINLDMYIFAIEDLFQLHFEIFSQNETVAQIEKFNVGDSFDKGIISKINTKDTSGDSYYHNIGISYNNRNGEHKFQDVYSLTRWFYDELFGEPKKIYKRKFQIKLGDKHYAIAYDTSHYGCYHVHEIDNKLIYASTDDRNIVKELLKVNFLDPTIVEIFDEVKIVD